MNPENPNNSTLIGHAGIAGMIDPATLGCSRAPCLCPACDAERAENAEIAKPADEFTLLKRRLARLEGRMRTEEGLTMSRRYENVARDAKIEHAAAVAHEAQKSAAVGIIYCGVTLVIVGIILSRYRTEIDTLADEVAKLTRKGLS